MNSYKKSGFEHFISAFRWSVDGFKSALREEAAFRQEMVLFVFLAPTGFWLGHTAIEIVFLVGSLFLVLIVELLNTAVETAIDRVGTEKHPLSKKAKDVGSAAVMLSILNVIFVWGVLILGPNI
ncbi:MAG: diacylglycerol kinase [Nitrospiria bacterium]